MIYTQQNLQDGILGDNIEAPTSIQKFMNQAVREVGSEIDLRMSKRKSRLSPSLYRGVFDYGAPADLKGWNLIDIIRQVLRVKDSEWVLTSNQEFDRTKTLAKNLITIADFDGVKKLRISADIPAKELIMHDMDSISGDGTWAASGNASNLSRDADDFLNGSASLKFDMANAYTSGLLTNSTMNAVDLTDYRDHEIFLWIYIPSTTGLSSIKLRWGSDSSNYWEATATTTNEGLAFSTGWNLIRFAWPATSTGSPTVSAVDYLRIEIVGSGAASASTGWRVDFLVARVGIIHDVLYYSRYLWQSSSGTYKENSTTTTDLLNCETEEFELFVLKGKQIVFEEDRMFDEAKRWFDRYELKKQDYLDKYPSERMDIVDTYQEFGTLEGGEE